MILKNKKKYIIISLILIFVVVFSLLVCFLVNKSDNISVYSGLIYEDADKYKNKIITNYEDYMEIINYYKIDSLLEKDMFDKNNFLVIISPGGSCDKIEEIVDVLVFEDTIDVSIDNYVTCENCSDVISYEVYFVSVDKTVSVADYLVTYVYNTVYGEKCDQG